MNDAAQPAAASSDAPAGGPAPLAGRKHERRLPEVYQIVVECHDEQHQRQLFERFSREGLKLRLLVL